jgi:hypothetical protein
MAWNKGPVNRNKFLKDLGDGKKAEEYIAKLYKDNFYPTCDYVTFWVGKEYDISFSFPRKDSIHVEVKFDKYAVKSGNLCFELLDHKGRPSGIMATEAHLMVFIVAENLDSPNKQIFEFEVKALREYIESYIDTATFKIVKGGDSNAFEMMLVPISTIVKEPFCKRILQ